MDTEALLGRLDAIGRSLDASGHALALIGLGSVGAELDRLDAYSDLDFFAIVEPGYKQKYIDDLGWLSSVCPIAYAFRNTPDGYKVLFDDGIFCEFAVFEEAELSRAAFSAGRIVWKQPHVSGSIHLSRRPAAAPKPASPEWAVGEALTNLYVGLGRYRRGEKLSALRFIQGYAVDRILDLSPSLGPETPSLRDPFAAERRYEQRHPDIARLLPSFAQGYDRSPESARAILGFLDSRFEINPALKQAILELCDGPGPEPAR